MGSIINIQQIIGNEVSVSDAKSMIIMHKGEAYTFFDEGCTRHVFVNKNDSKVIKILRRNYGLNYNEEEVKIYENASNGDKGQMTNTTIFNGIIEQDFCTPIKFGGKRLNANEKSFAKSCRDEVGWTEDGKLVCFDLDEFKKY
jgi:hypothetical protein